MKLNKKRVTPLLALSTVMLCILSLTISVNGQTSTNSDMKTATLTETNAIPNRNSTATNSTFPLLATLNSNYSTKVYVPNSSDQQQAVSILNRVVGIDISAYTINLYGEKTNDYFSRSQNRVEYYLSSEQGSMRIACSFINNNLHQIYISDWTGSLPLDQETSELDRTKSFLQEYKDLTKNSLYDTLLYMLADVKPNENVTKTSGNVNLKVNVIEEADVNFIWTYVDQNGIIAQTKNVVLSYNEGRLQSFQDNWDLYQISGSAIVTEKEAIATALSAIQHFEYNISTSDGEVTVSDFKAKVVTDLVLSYLNEFGTEARDNDPFTLYPSWYVPLGFDKVYSGGVTGAVVRVWADNGEVSSINPMMYGTGNEKTTAESDTTASGLLPNAILAILVAGTAVSYFMYALLFKRSRPSSWKTLCLCGLITFSLLATTIQTVNAYPNSKAEIYASYWEQPPVERTAMQSLTSTIQSYFSSVGYDTGRYCGTESSSTVYSNIQSDQQNYNRVAVFHFGHMAGPGNYHCSDSSEVTYPNVYSYTNEDAHFFALMWVCNSADNDQYQPNVNALARSWAHHSDLAPNGYTSPDTNPDCFIGFHNMSPTLTWAIYNTTTITGQAFIEKFYWYALIQGGYSVRDSLNQASEALFGIPFVETDLLNGVFSYYPGDEIDPEHPNPAGDYPCTMKVYGNSRIYLRQYYPYYHEQSIVWGAGAVNNPTNVHGPAPDGTYTQLWGGNPGDGGVVVSMMTGSVGYDGGGFSRGHIYLAGYSVSGYYSHLYVYVSQNNNNDWQLVNQGYVTSSTPSWYDIGQAPSNFKYIAIVGIDDEGWSCNLMVDAVRVIP
jgi:hypothetical protein